jgi:hypothetical protein
MTTTDKTTLIQAKLMISAACLAAVESARFW